MNHSFDKRMDSALAALAEKTTTQPVKCLSCGEQVTEPNSPCEGSHRRPNVQSTNDSAGTTRQEHPFA